MLNVAEIRKDFPILTERVNDRDLIYLDNAATTQMPKAVLDTIANHYSHVNANVHRGIHTLSEKSTSDFENARRIVAGFLNAASEEEIVFTSGTTDSLNTIARGLETYVNQGDTVLVTNLEHHSNFVPWQMLCKRRGANFLVLDCKEGRFDMDAFVKMLDKKPKIVAVAHASNLTGTLLPIKEITSLAHRYGALVSIDGAQGVRHSLVDVQDIDCDFYSFSGHKILGPSGIGVLYGKKEALEKLEPMRFGGGMVDLVEEAETTFGTLPIRLEAGTPNFSGAIALGAALKYMENIGRDAICAYEEELTDYALNALKNQEGLTIYGNPEKRVGVISFNINGVHSYDAASMIDKLGVALRSGNHCAQPAMKMLGQTAVLRLSVAFYNTKEEIDEAIKAIEKVKTMFAKYM